MPACRETGDIRKTSKQERAGGGCGDRTHGQGDQGVRQGLCCSLRFCHLSTAVQVTHVVLSYILCSCELRNHPFVTEIQVATKRRRRVVFNTLQAVPELILQPLLIPSIHTVSM